MLSRRSPARRSPRKIPLRTPSCPSPSTASQPRPCAGIPRSHTPHDPLLLPSLPPPLPSPAHPPSVSAPVRQGPSGRASMNIHTFATPVTLLPVRFLAPISPLPFSPPPNLLRRRVLLPFLSHPVRGPVRAQSRRMVVALYQDTLTYENMVATGRGVLQAWHPLATRPAAAPPPTQCKGNPKPSPDPRKPCVRRVRQILRADHGRLVQLLGKTKGREVDKVSSPPPLLFPFFLRCIGARYRKKRQCNIGRGTSLRVSVCPSVSARTAGGAQENRGGARGALRRGDACGLPRRGADSAPTDTRTSPHPSRTLIPSLARHAPLRVLTHSS